MRPMPYPFPFPMPLPYPPFPYPYPPVGCLPWRPEPIVVNDPGFSPKPQPGQVIGL